MTDFTKRSMETSLLELLKKKPLNKITINDITEKCGISRMTFYYHFKDIYDLLEWSMQDVCGKIFSAKEKGERWQDCFLQVLKQMQENSQVLQNIVKSVSRENMNEYFFKKAFSFVDEYIIEAAEGMKIAEEDMQFITNITEYAMTGVIARWANNGMKEEPERIIGRLDRIFNGTVELALSNAEVKQ